MNKKVFLIAAVLSASIFSVAGAQQVARITPSGIGYLEYLPDGYNSNSNRYPVVIALHGIKERGTSSTNPSQVLHDVSRVASVGLPKYVKSGKKYPFILISPQLKIKYGSWPPSYVMEVINHVKKTLRIDHNRIYLTGLSLGGFGVWRTAGEYPEAFAAIAPICSGGNSLDKAGMIAKENLPVWGFHGDNDKIVSYTVTTKMVNAINSAPTKPNPLAKVTIFPRAGHIIWDMAYNETNVIEWMLGFRNGSGTQGGQSSVNNPPVADAGKDHTITLPTTSLTLQGRASDADGKVASMLWTKVSGGTAVLSQASSDKLQISDLEKGTYTFKFTVTDNEGASSSDEVKVTVQGFDNKRPVVNAGVDKMITLPTNAVKLSGTASDEDGDIKALLWTKVSGGAARLSEEATSELTISDLVAGVYVFRLTAEDNDGATAFDEVRVTVKEGAASNKAPVANAGPDRTLTLPYNSAKLQGGAHDEDGTVVSYQWTQLSGKNASLSNTSSAVAEVSGLLEGTYIFQLKVKDDKGAISTDEVRVSVIAQPSTKTESNANKTANGIEILPQSYPGPDRSNGTAIDYVPIDDLPWVTRK